jgi:hypothetical protein
MKTEILNFFTMVAPKKKSGFLVFCFRSENRKPLQKIFFTKSRFGTTMAGKTAKKHPESHLGLISVDLTLADKKVCRFFPGSACRK